MNRVQPLLAVAAIFLLLGGFFFFFASSALLCFDICQANISFTQLKLAGEFLGLGVAVGTFLWLYGVVAHARHREWSRFAALLLIPLAITAALVVGVPVSTLQIGGALRDPAVDVVLKVVYWWAVVLLVGLAVVWTLIGLWRASAPR